MLRAKNYHYICVKYWQSICFVRKEIIMYTSCISIYSCPLRLCHIMGYEFLLISFEKLRVMFPLYWPSCFENSWLCLRTTSSADWRKCAIIPNILKYVSIALESTPENPPDDLTHDESAAMCLYTTEWTGENKSLYTILNYTLNSWSLKFETMDTWILYCSGEICCLQWSSMYEIRRFQKRQGTWPSSIQFWRIYSQSVA